MITAHIRRTLALFLLISSVSLVVAAQSAPAAGAGTVSLPLAEYDRLLERANRPTPVPPLPPVPSAMARAELVLRPEAGTVNGVLSVQGEVYRDGFVKIPLLSGGTLVEATGSGANVPLLVDGGVTAAVLKGPAPFSLSISWATELGSEPGRAVAALPAVYGGSVRATIDLPGDNPDVRIEPGLVTARTSSNGRTRVELTLPPGQPSRLSWSSRDSAAGRPNREVRLTADARSLITIGENDVRLGTLFDVSVAQGEPEELSVLLPPGFEVAGVTGASVETGPAAAGQLRLTIREPGRRRHQFLVALEKAAPSGVTEEEFALPGIAGVLRETGEVALEAVGTVDLSASEKGALRRLDVAEVGATLTGLARSPLLSAFRYQRRESERVPVSFQVRRFPDASVLAAAADRAEATTLITTEGRTLTEVTLTVRNREQLFLKVNLPAGSSLLSAEVAGEAVKPVEGSDGSRVPLVRPGFQPTGPYSVSFVYVTNGTPLGKKGETSLSLAKMGIPINMVTWELFVPERYEVKRLEGDVIRRDLLGPLATGTMALDTSRLTTGNPRLEQLDSNDVGGVVVDATGAVLPGVTITLTADEWVRTTATDSSGVFVVPGVPSRPVTVRASLEGFKTVQTQLSGPGAGPVTLTLEIASLQETVTVVSEETPTPDRDQRQKAPSVPSQAASQNVFNLQRRVSGVLPVRIDVPRAGHSYLLARPLVLDEPTVVTFEYRQK